MIILERHRLRVTIEQTLAKGIRVPLTIIIGMEDEGDKETK